MFEIANDILVKMVSSRAYVSSWEGYVHLSGESVHNDCLCWGLFAEAVVVIWEDLHRRERRRRDSSKITAATEYQQARSAVLLVMASCTCRQGGEGTHRTGIIPNETFLDVVS